MKQSRPAATSLRAKKYGRANQMAYEMSEKMERKAMKDKLGAQRKARLSGAAAAAKKKKASTGVNAGTYGGARSSLASAWFSTARR